MYYNDNDNNKGVSWFHRLYMFFFLANYVYSTFYYSFQHIVFIFQYYYLICLLA